MSARTRFPGDPPGILTLGVTSITRSAMAATPVAEPATPASHWRGDDFGDMAMQFAHKKPPNNIHTILSDHSCQWGMHL